MKKIALLLAITFTITILPGCNTVHGFGKDLGKIGEKIEGKPAK